MDNFSIAKEAVSAVDAWEAYGNAPIKRGFVSCIYHSEKTPSMRIYDGARGFFCFSCSTGGDVIKLTADLLGLTPVEALRRLNADFNIGLDLDKPPDQGAIHRAQERKRAIESFEAWRGQAFVKLSAYHRMLWKAKKESPMLLEQFSPLQIEALQEIDKISYYLDCLEDDPMGFYRTNRDYIAEIARRLEGMKTSVEVFG